VRRLVAVLALCLMPTALPAQRVASARAGFAQSTSFAARVDTTAGGTTEHGHARLKHALIGGGVGLLLGMWIGNEEDRARQRRCPHTDSLCHVEGVGGAIGAVIGFVAGTVTGALWPTR